MGIQIKPSDLYYKYPRIKETREEPKFSGKPDPYPFERDDQYEVIPMFEAVMDELNLDDAAALQKIEEIMIYEMPVFIRTREEVFDYLVETVRGLMRI